MPNPNSVPRSEYDKVAKKLEYAKECSFAQHKELMRVEEENRILRERIEILEKEIKANVNQEKDD